MKMSAEDLKKELSETLISAYNKLKEYVDNLQDYKAKVEEKNDRKSTKANR